MHIGALAMEQQLGRRAVEGGEHHLRLPVRDAHPVQHPAQPAPVDAGERNPDAMALLTTPPGRKNVRRGSPLRRGAYVALGLVEPTE